MQRLINSLYHRFVETELLLCQLLDAKMAELAGDDGWGDEKVTVVTVLTGRLVRCATVFLSVYSTGRLGKEFALAKACRHEQLLLITLTSNC
jgi:hypothetical protein